MKKIERERLWVFSPVTNIYFQAYFSGCREEQTFLDAVNRVLDSYDVLKTKVVEKKEEGSFSNDFYFEPTGEVHCKIVKDSRKMSELISEQEKIAIDIWNGEYLRLFYDEQEDGFRIVLITHHVLGDGLSFSYLLEKIIYALNGEELTVTPIDEFDFKALLKGTKLKFPVPIMMQSMNKKWRKTGTVFHENEGRKAAEKYWQSHSTYTEYACLDEGALKRLKQFSKTAQVTINTLIIAAFLAADKECKSTGMAVSVRPDSDKSMGLNATGISVDYQYNTGISVEANAQIIQKKIHKKSDDKNSKFFLINFLCGMEQSLLDAIYFSVVGLTDNKVAAQFAKLFGYAGNPQQSLSITNLRVLPIETQKGNIRLQDVIFSPPLVLNAKLLIGVATTNDSMWFTMQVQDDGEVEQNRQIFKQALKTLNQLK